VERIDRPAWWAYFLGAAAFLLVLGEGVFFGEVTSNLIERSCWAMLISGTCGLFLGNLLRRAIFDPRHAIRVPRAAAAGAADPAAAPPSAGTSTLAKEPA
jgi:hypothetical protein